MRKKDPKASFKEGKFTVKYSKSNKTWQVWHGKSLDTDFVSKVVARNYAKRHK